MTEAPAIERVAAPSAAGLLRSTGAQAVGAAVVLTYLLNGAFMLVMTRVLDEGQFSLLAALFTVILVSNVPTLALQAGVARGMAQRLRTGGETAAGAVLRRALATVLRWQAILLAGALVAAYPLVHVLHVEDGVPAVATVITVVLGVLVPVALGGLQAHERFVELSLLQFLYAALKFPACIGLVGLGLGVGGIMIGVSLATAATVAVGLWLLRSTIASARHVRADRTELLRDSALAAVSLTLWTGMAYLDQVVARLSFPHETAGVFAAASTAAKLVFAVPAVAVTILFPRVAALGDPLRAREHLVTGVRFVATFAALGTTLCFVAPHLLLSISVGEKYTEAAPWLPWLALTMSLFAIAQVYVVHFVALGRRRFPLVLAAGVVLEVAAFALLHGSPGDLVAVELAGAGALVVAAELYDRFRA